MTLAKACGLEKYLVLFIEKRDHCVILESDSCLKHLTGPVITIEQLHVTSGQPDRKGAVKEGIINKIFYIILGEFDSSTTINKSKYTYVKGNQLMQ